MVLDENEVAGLERRIHAPRGVREHDHLDAQRRGHPHRGRHHLGGVPFVEVEATGLQEHGALREAPAHVAPRVTDHAGGRIAGQVREGHDDRVDHGVGEVAQPGAQDQQHLGIAPQARAQRAGGGLDVERCHL